jgi:hypothetical protein
LNVFRLALRLALAAIYAGLTAAPAWAAYCGVPDDIKPIVKLTIATYPRVSHTSHTIGESMIRIVSVNGTYAYSVTDDGSARIRFYWEKPTGTWHFVSANHAPAGWEKPLLEFFQASDTAPAGSPSACNNPNWKKP